MLRGGWRRVIKFEVLVQVRYVGMSTGPKPRALTGPLQQLLQCCLLCPMNEMPVSAACSSSSSPFALDSMIGVIRGLTDAPEPAGLPVSASGTRLTFGASLAQA